MRNREYIVDFGAKRHRALATDYITQEVDFVKLPKSLIALLLRVLEKEAQKLTEDENTAAELGELKRVFTAYVNKKFIGYVDSNTGKFITTV